MGLGWPRKQARPAAGWPGRIVWTLARMVRRSWPQSYVAPQAGGGLLPSARAPETHQGSGPTTVRSSAHGGNTCAWWAYRRPPGNKERVPGMPGRRGNWARRAFLPRWNNARPAPSSPTSCPPCLHLSTPPIPPPHFCSSSPPSLVPPHSPGNALQPPGRPADSP